MAKTQTDPFAPGSALESAHFFTQDLGVPLPPIPEPLLPCLKKKGEAVYSTRTSVDSLEDREALVAEMVAGTGPSYVAFGHEGYGINNWFFRYAASLPNIAIFIEIPHGGVYSDPELTTNEIAMALHTASHIIQATMSGSRPRLVVEYLGPSGGRWCLSQSEGEPEWRQSSDALSRVASALLDTTTGSS